MHVRLTSDVPPLSLALACLRSDHLLEHVPHLRCDAAQRVELPTVHDLLPAVEGDDLAGDPRGVVGNQIGGLHRKCAEGVQVCKGARKQGSKEARKQGSKEKSRNEYLLTVPPNSTSYQYPLPVPPTSTPYQYPLPVPPTSTSCQYLPT